MKRSPIQIELEVHGDGSVILHALCNDGTMWYRANAPGSRWLQTPAIPEDEERLPTDNPKIRPKGKPLPPVDQPAEATNAEELDMRAKP